MHRHQLRDEPRFALEPLAERPVRRQCLGENLDGDRTIEAGVAGLVDLEASAGREAHRSAEDYAPAPRLESARGQAVRRRGPTHLFPGLVQ